MRRAERGQADVAKRGLAPPDQDRRAIPVNAVHQIGGKKGCRGFGTPFDVKILDIGHG